jgi:inosine-uridine nucleoside N-ribohydrolase
MGKRKIILDVDTGTDDAMAILTAALSGEFDILGITVVQGNLPLKNTLENTLRVVQFLGLDIPVYSGCPSPMVQTLSRGRMQNQIVQVFEKEINGVKTNIHDEYLDLPEARIKPQKQHAVSFLLECLDNAEEKITIISVGPPTNLGMALRMKPEITDKIEEIIIMGGGVDRANRTSAAEMNFYMDPEASQILVQADVQKYIFPLDATCSILFSKKEAAEIAALENPYAEFFASLMTHFIDRITALGISNNSRLNCHDIAIHDVLCVLFLIDPAIVLEMKKENCDVDFSGGIADGQLIVDRRSYAEPRGKNIVAYKLDKARVMDLLLRILKV